MNEMVLGEIPDGFSDGAYNDVVIHFDWRDRIRILFGRRVRVLAYTVTENKVGKTRGMARVFVSPVIPVPAHLEGQAIAGERQIGYARNERRAMAFDCPVEK